MEAFQKYGFFMLISIRKVITCFRWCYLEIQSPVLMNY